jgi:biofilm PGA synthesis N-glycosyltransferase PgaC
MTAYCFWIALCFILYTYLLYPAIIIVLSGLKRHSPPPEQDDDTLPSVTLIVVVYNEEHRVEPKLENCRALDYPRPLLTICFASDGSDDGTNEILARQGDIVFMADEINRGKPHQINRAAAGCNSDIIAFSDVRQLFEPDAIRKLVRNFQDTAIGAVSGELTFRRADEHTGKSIGIYWWYEKVLRRAESRIDSTLGVTGAIYAIRRELFEPIPDDTILDDIEIPLKAFRKGRRVIFEPDAVAYDTAVTAIGLEFKRKVRTLAGNLQLFRRNLWLLNPFANRIFAQSISHKLFRLFIPYALIVTLVASGIQDGAPLQAFFWIQLLCYLCGALAVLCPPLRKNRLLNFIAVFLTLNAAAVTALYRTLLKKTDARWKKY